MEGQIALTRLLNSNSAKLSSKVTDGEWKKGIYPTNDPAEIASGLVWRMLGSSHASNRWRAAHSVRCFAKFGRWNVIDALVNRFRTTDAHPFQAPELSFYYLHARLWLLIALARIAMDYPEKIALYQKILQQIVLDKDSPHVLMRHFASQAIITCIDNGKLILPMKREIQIRFINQSPFPRLRKKLREGKPDSFYQGRPKDAPIPKTEFHLDYDFNKYDVRHLSRVFGKSGWEVIDLISETVHNFDPLIKNMYETDGRQRRRRDHIDGMASKHHSYGQQLGWHALFLVAGRLLSEFPVTDDSYEQEPWADFLNGYLLTRKDGLWLSDGIDRAPLTTKINLLEKGSDGLAITGDKAKILGLIELDSGLRNQVVVGGDWSSLDNIDVHIRSVLVAPRRLRL